MMTAVHSVCLRVTTYKVPSLFRSLKHIPATGCFFPQVQSQNTLVANGYHIQYGRSVQLTRSYSSNSNTFIQCVQKQANGETIIRSPYQDVEHCDKTFGEFMFSHLDEFRDLEMMVDYPTGRSYTGAKIKETAIKLASAMTKLGYKKGDVVLIVSTNCPEYIIIFLACGVLGVAVSTANPAYTAGELSRQIVHCEAKAVFSHKALVHTVQEALKCSVGKISHNVKEIITLYGQADKCRDFESLIQDDGSSFPENVDINPSETVLALPYSSGTTGLPKGVMLSHTNLVMNLLQGKFGQMTFRKGEEILLGLLPFYHIYGMFVLQFETLVQGAKLIIHPKFEPTTFLQSIQDHKITYCHLVPPLVLFLAKDPSISLYDISSVEKIVCGAAPLGKSVTLELERKLNITVTQAYGMTECSPLTHHDHFPPRHGTIGRLVPSTLGKIVDPVTGHVLDVGETGEIVLKGPQVMLGYLKDKDATNRTIDNDGWIYSGDIGHVDSEGYFTVSDRLKELIKYKGFQVAPAELEALLCSHPSIQDAAVVGLQAEDIGEIPKAFVVKKPDVEITSDDIVAYVQENVAWYKNLRGGVEFIEQIPKTASGKILRRLLKK